MTIDSDLSNLITLSQAAKLIPERDGSPAHVSKLTRWIVRGVKVKGQQIQLEAVRMGHGWFTTTEAIREFAERQTDPYRKSTTAPVSGKPPKPSRQVKQAEAALDRAGI